MAQPGPDRASVAPIEAKSGRRRRFAEWWGDYHWFFLGGVALLALVLGIVGFRQWYSAHDTAGATFWDAIYKAAQLFTLESGSADVPVPPLLNTARFLGMIAVFYGAGAALVTVFGEGIRRLFLRWASGHVIVCGLGDRGLHITQQLLRKDGVDWRPRVAVIDQDENAPLLDRARRAGATIVIGDATDQSALKKVNAHRAACVFAVCPEDGQNAEIVVHLEKLVRAKQPGSQVKAVVHIDDTELCGLLREQVKLGDWPHQLKLSFFNVPERGARAMLDAVPEAFSPGAAPHIVVVGLGKLGRSLVMQAAQAWHGSRRPGLPLPRVTMIDLAARAKADLLRIRYPEIASSPEARIDRVCILNPLTMPKSDPRFEEGGYLRDTAGELDVDAVFVCPDDDVHSLAAALVIQRHTREGHIPIAVRMTREGGLATLLDTGGDSAFADLRPVGVLNHACNPRALLEQEDDLPGLPGGSLSSEPLPASAGPV